MSRSILTNKTRKICIGDLNRTVTLAKRVFNSPSFSSSFVDPFKAPVPTNNTEFIDKRVTRANIRTLSGREIIANTGTDAEGATHRIVTWFSPDINATSTWILIGEKKFKSLSVENVDELDQMVIILAADRGTSPAAEA